MAKVTMDDMVFEGTPEEIAAVFAEMEKRQEKDEACVDEPKEEPLKVGDYVKVIKPSFVMSGFENGDICKVSHLNYGGTYSILIEKIDSYLGGFGALGEHFVKAAEEEVVAAKAEIETKSKWAKIGRVVNEFKVGDIIHVDATSAFGVNTFGEVVREADEDGDLRVEAVDDAGDEEEFFVPTEKATLVTPVEARFDR